MKVIFGLALVWASVKPSRFQCVLEKEYFCSSIPNAFPEGLTSVLFVVTNLGVLNSTTFRAASLATVTSLALANSGITEIEPGAFHAFHNLAKLSLYRNSLTEVTSSWLSNPGRLENLTVARNRITEIGPNTFSGFFNLTTLNLANNQISQIAAGSFADLVKLTLLDLSNNNLTTLKRNAFSGLRTPAMKLGANPWNCSCDLRDFRSFLRELMNASLLEDAASVVCHSPLSLAGTCVWNVSDLNCPTDFVSPVSGNSFYRIGLPVLIACLVSLPFALVAFFIWLAKRNRKQVEPNTVTSSQNSSVKLGGRVDPVAKREGSDEKAKSAETGTLPRLETRARSASAILLQAEFHRRPQPTSNLGCPNQEHQGAITYMAINDTIPAGSKDLQNARVLWSYDKLEKDSGGKLQSSYKTIPEIHRERTGGSVSLKASEQIPSKTEVDDIKEGKTREDPEPFLYLSVATATEEWVNNEPQQDVASKPVQSSLKRVLTWPHERHLWGQESGGLRIRKSFLTPFFLPTFEQTEPLDMGRPEIHGKWFHAHSQEVQQLQGAGKVELSKGQKLTQEAEASEIATAGSCDSFGFSGCDVSPSAGRNNGGTELRTEPTLMGQPETLLEKEPAVSITTGSIYASPSGLRSTKYPRGMKNRPSKAVPCQTGVHQESCPSSVFLGSNAVGSSYDDTILENSGYSYINLLHEVVENRGRWTRERWKQTHQKWAIGHPPTKSK